MKIIVLTATLLAMLTSGCASINSISLTPIPSDRQNHVAVEKSKFIFLAFNFDNDFIDDVSEDLKRQCPNGNITGLLTKDENINYFLYFFWKKRITVSGYCVTKTATASQKVKVRGTASEESTASQNNLPESAQ